MLKNLISKFTALLCALVLIIPNVGCTSQATIAALTSTLGNAASSIAALEGNADLAVKLKADTAAAVSAVTNWKSGTPASEAIEALNLVEDDLNLIPAASQYTPLIDLAIGTVESILALLPQSQTIATPTLAAHTAAHKRKVTLINPPKTAKQFKAQWQNVINANPQLSNAAIK